MCKETKSQLDRCECDGALKMGAYCMDCQKALKGMNDCKCDPVETYNLLKTGMVGGPAASFYEISRERCDVYQITYGTREIM